ncbi:MAG: SIMPL domain-containing protein [Polyangiaceae bacterium]|nr:SIMPL domain-containing protein [Polyangiaceae bacterium]
MAKEVLFFLAFLACGCGSGASSRPPTIKIYQEAEAAPTRFVGEGRLSHPPEFVELSVKIASECYATPLQASEANQRAVADVMSFFKTLSSTENEHDGVHSKGGYSSPFRRREGSLVSCKGTFAKSTIVQMKSSDISKFAQNFDKIQKKIYGAFSKKGEGLTDSPVTFATIVTPRPQLSHQTREKLEKEALRLAVESAKAKFETTFSAACGDGSYRILRMNEPSAESGRPMPYGLALGDAHSSPSTIAFEEIWVNRTLVVDFEFNGRDCGPVSE